MGAVFTVFTGKQEVIRPLPATTLDEELKGFLREFDFAAFAILGVFNRKPFVEKVRVPDAQRQEFALPAAICETECKERAQPEFVSIRGEAFVLLWDDEPLPWR